MYAACAAGPSDTMTNATQQSDVGLIGLAVMGQNLALNLADHSYNVAVYNRTHAVTETFVGEHRDHVPGGLLGSDSLENLVDALAKPRVIIVLVKSGPAVDAVCEGLIRAGIEPDDIVVDGGNSLWTDTIRREREYRGSLTFFGSGISGGELGARFGPSLMPGGDAAAWQRLKPIWESIAAKVDAATGKPFGEAAPGKPITGGEPCTAFIGANGAGHYVKMVHNGIEYADMQLIAEAYHLLREGAGLTTDELADVFEEWNGTDLESYLIEITADILRQRDPETGRPFVDVVLDRAGQKGTGRWTAANALELGTPAMTITEAVFARAISARKDERERAARHIAGPLQRPIQDRDAVIDQVGEALYCAKVAAYAQGFELLAAAQHEYEWEFNFADIARIWRGGCIIRARLLNEIMQAYERNPSLQNPLVDEYFVREIAARQVSWREVVALGAMQGVSMPGFGSALAYFDGMRSATLPANLIQAQRDYFGAHGYERIDQPRGQLFHLDWPDPERPQIKR